MNSDGSSLFISGAIITPPYLMLGRLTFTRITCSSRTAKMDEGEKDALSTLPGWAGEPDESGSPLPLLSSWTEDGMAWHGMARKSTSCSSTKIITIIMISANNAARGSWSPLSIRRTDPAQPNLHRGTGYAQPPSERIECSFPGARTRVFPILFFFPGWRWFF